MAAARIGRGRRTAAWAATLALASACGAQFDGHVFRSGELEFRLGPVPAEWRRIEAANTLLAFRDDGDGATVAVNGRCGKDGDDVPLQSLTHHLFLHFTDRKILGQETRQIDGREAMRTELVAELDGVPKHFTVFVLKKDGCVYDFLHISATATDSGAEEFERFVLGFRTLG